jgi:hypothetical protein
MKNLVFILAFGCSISVGQSLTTPEIVRMIRLEEPAEMEDYLTDKQFLYMSTEKKEGGKLYSFLSKDSRSSFQRLFSKDQFKNYVIIETDDQEWVEGIKKHCEKMRYIVNKEVQAPAMQLYNRTYTFDITPGESAEYRIKIYHTPKSTSKKKKS